jgi:hypothetical protein
MPPTPLSPDDLQQLRELILGWGKIVANRSGLDPSQLDFNAIEATAQMAAAALLEGTAAAFLQKLNDGFPTQQPCPHCQRTCPVTFAVRTLHLQGGHTVPHKEPVAHCPTCRRDFFPPADATPPG